MEAGPVFDAKGKRVEPSSVEGRAKQGDLLVARSMLSDCWAIKVLKSRSPTLS